MLPVVVCGAGPVGLVQALELAAWQVPVLLLERHRLPSPFPRGRAISTRSMEILRQLGLEREVTEIGLPRTETQHFFAAGSLTAPEFRPDRQPTCLRRDCDEPHREPGLPAGPVRSVTPRKSR